MGKFPSTNMGFWPEPARAAREVHGESRDNVRLMILDRTTGSMGHNVFGNLAEFFSPGGLLIVNKTRTIPAALLADVNGHPQVLHLAAHQSSHQVIAELRKIDRTPDGRIIESGAVVTILNIEHQSVSSGRVRKHFHPNNRFWTIATKHDWYDLARAIGRPIRYHYVDAPYDIKYYATLFGTIWGSSEIPSASRPFTDAMVHRLLKQGVEIVPLTLHTTVSSHEVPRRRPSSPSRSGMVCYSCRHNSHGPGRFPKPPPYYCRGHNRGPRTRNLVLHPKTQRLDHPFGHAQNAPSTCNRASR